MPEGIDYAFGRPGIAALKAAGVKFVCRYLSHSPTKNLTSAEAHALSAAGIWIVVVWETTAQRALAGRTAGVADAIDAQMQAQACGMPAGRPVYFAVDWDASASQQLAINTYLDGAASVLGRDRVGIYGGYGPVKRALDAGKAKWAWQTYAWSGGKWDGRAQLQQYSNGHTLGGVGCDYDRATKADYGQWRVGVTPSPQAQEEDEMKQRQLNPGMDGRSGLIIADKAHTTFEAFFDNSYTDGGQVKASDPVKIRITVEKSTGGWQTEHLTVGRGAKDTKQPRAKFALADKNSVAVSVTRESGDGTEPIVIAVY